MSYCTASGSSDFYHNAGNLLFKNSAPNKLRPLISGRDTVLRWLSNQPEFSNFVSLIYMANLTELFDNISSNLTVFAPTNEAMSKRPELLCSLTRGKARLIVYHHVTRDVPLCLSDIANNMFEVKNPIDTVMTIDGRRKPFQVGYNSIGTSFGLEYNTLANMVSTVEFLTNNGVIHPIDECIFPKCDTL